VLQLREIQKRFAGVHALRGVSLEVYAGEIVALLGENGAGKSTLMNVVGGVQQPDSGEILVDGARVVMRDVHTATALGIGFIHQELNLLDNLDVAGNVLLGREPTRWGALRVIDRPKMREHVRPYLDQLGVGIRPDTPMAALSIAQQQLVEIAKALSLNARLLIMDEPTSSLTLAETARLHEIVSSLRERGVAVIYITHRLGEVRTLADRAVVLRDGANAGVLARQELTHDNIIRLMVGREIAVQAGDVTRTGRDYFRVDGLRTRRYPAACGVVRRRPREILGMAGLVGAGARRSRARCSASNRRSPERQPRRTAAADRRARGRDPHGIFLVPEDRGRRARRGFLDSRERVAPGARQIRAARLRLRDAGASGRRRGLRQLQVKAPSIEVEARP
jgi:ribose transport system ATP-binding protein